MLPEVIQFYNNLPDICSFCQREYSLQNPRTLDHIIPFHTFGTKNRNKSLGYRGISNLLMCCKECNQLKGGHSLTKFQAKLTNPNPKYDIRFLVVPFELRCIMVQSINVLLSNEENN